MYGQSSGQTNTLFKIYENDIHKVKIGYPSDWKQIPNSMLPVDSISEVYCSKYGR